MSTGEILVGAAVLFAAHQLVFQNVEESARAALVSTWATRAGDEDIDLPSRT